MYKAVEVSPGQRIVAQRWEGYWDPSAAKAKTVEFRSMPQAETRLNAVRWVRCTSLRDGPQRKPADASNLVVDVGPTLNVYTMYTNLTAPIFKASRPGRPSSTQSIAIDW